MSKNKRTVDDITRQIERVQAFVASGALSKYALATRADVGVATLTGMESPDWNPLSGTLARLVRAINKWEAEHPKERPNRRAEARMEVT